MVTKRGTGGEVKRRRRSGSSRGGSENRDLKGGVKQDVIEGHEGRANRKKEKIQARNRAEKVWAYFFGRCE